MFMIRKTRLRRRKFVRLTIGAVLTIGFVWLVARQVSINEIESAIQTANVSWLVYAVVALVCGYVARVERWRIMLAVSNPRIRFAQCVGPFIASFAINNTVPLRAGDVARAFAFRRELDVSPGAVIGTLFVERMLDLFSVLVFFGVVPFALRLDLTKVTDASSGLCLLLAAVVLSALLVPHLFVVPIRWLARLVSRVFPRIADAVTNETEKLVATAIQLGRPQTVLGLALVSLLAWLLEGLVFWFAALALPSITHSAAAWLALPAGTISTLIPSAPGYVGTFDYVTAGVMRLSADNAAAASVIFAITVHLLLWLPITAGGGLYLLLRRQLLKHVQRTIERGTHK